MAENSWKSTKPLVFVMDDVPTDKKKKTKDEKKSKKKEKGPTFNLKNCGALLDIGKVKGATSMTLAWRCRFFGFAKFPNHMFSKMLLFLFLVRLHIVTATESECLYAITDFYSTSQFRINLYRKEFFETVF